MLADMSVTLDIIMLKETKNRRAVLLFQIMLAITITCLVSDSAK